MEFGAHLPLIAFDGRSPGPDELRPYARSARDSGFTFLCANDHLLFARPWLDGPLALASVLADAGEMSVATTIALPVIRGPIATAKTLAALDVLSGGRLVAGVGPGSSAKDYDAVGIPFEERWGRFDEAIAMLRALLRSDAPAFEGSYYSSSGIVLEPPPATPEGPPIWVASWGSDAGMRRVERRGDGWLASGYNITPELFAERLETLPDGFPNAVGTLWMYIAESEADAERVLTEVLAPMLGRDVDVLRELALPIGSAERCAERMQAWADAGVQRGFVWPLADPVRQLELFAERVLPAVSRAPQ
jgi:alkanesulfonate monooxygenase SsuD/methylene tetrahydromethanopterin reductase-like flavin-dependent oxidoreductase (luciferase family)